MNIHSHPRFDQEQFNYFIKLQQIIDMQEVQEVYFEYTCDVERTNLEEKIIENSTLRSKTENFRLDHIPNREKGKAIALLICEIYPIAEKKVIEGIENPIKISLTITTNLTILNEKIKVIKTLCLPTEYKHLKV